MRKLFATLMMLLTITVFVLANNMGDVRFTDITEFEYTNELSFYTASMVDFGFSVEMETSYDLADLVITCNASDTGEATTNGPGGGDQDEEWAIAYPIFDFNKI